jgi:hypothetical protein
MTIVPSALEGAIMMTKNPIILPHLIPLHYPIIKNQKFPNYNVPIASYT